MNAQINSQQDTKQGSEAPQARNQVNDSKQIEVEKPVKVTKLIYKLVLTYGNYLLAYNFLSHF